MEDTEAEVNAKIKKCYCPPKEIAGNPVIDCIMIIIHTRVRWVWCVRC